MLKLFSCLLTIFLAQGAEAPFWKKKAKLFERIQNHEVIVSVSALAKSHESPLYRLQLVGGGHVNAPCDFVYKTAHNYEQLSRLSGFVEKSQYNPSTHSLGLTISTFFHRSTFQLEIEEAKGPLRELVFRVNSGPMRGFWWKIGFADILGAKCEISLDGEYKYDQFPIPKLFLEFGLEAIFRHMAERLRSFTELDYKKLELKTPSKGQSGGQASATYERIPALKARPFGSVILEQKFTYERRVAFSDTDAMGVVHHANYLRFCEEARVAWMRAKDLGSTHYPKTDKVLAVLHYQVWHKKPAFFDDPLQVTLQVRREGVKIQFQYSIFKAADLIAQAETLHIPVDRELRPVRPGQELLKQLEKEPWTETWLSNS